MTGSTMRAGVLVLVAGELRFLPASVAVRVTRTPPVTAVPGSAPDLLGIALHEGTIVPVLTIGLARRDMVVCECAGELMGVVGGEVVRAGMFEVAGEDPDAVEYEGRLARVMDVEALYARWQKSRGPGHLGLGDRN